MPSRHVSKEAYACVEFDKHWPWQDLKNNILAFLARTVINPWRDTCNKQMMISQSVVLIRCLNTEKDGKTEQCLDPATVNHWSITFSIKDESLLFSVRLSSFVDRLRNPTMCQKAFCDLCGKATWAGKASRVCLSYSSLFILRLRRAYWTSTERCTSRRALPMRTGNSLHDRRKSNWRLSNLMGHGKPWSFVSTNPYD